MQMFLFLSLFSSDSEIKMSDLDLKTNIDLFLEAESDEDIEYYIS